MSFTYKCLASATLLPSQFFARLVQQQLTILTRITISSLDSPSISDLRSYYKMSHTSDYHHSDSKGYHPALAHPKYDRANTPCPETFARWPCSYVYLGLPDDDESAEIEYLDLQDRASEVKKTLEECSLLIGRRTQSEKALKQLLTDFIMFTHTLLKIEVKSKWVLYSRGLDPPVLRVPSP